MKDVSSKKRHALVVMLGAAVVLITGAVLLPGESSRAKAETTTPVAPSVTASVTSATSTTPPASTPATSPANGASPTATSTPPTTAQRHTRFKSADGAFRRATFQPGQAVTSSGMFFVDIDTGVIENWSLAGRPAGGASAVFYQVSDDSRYVVAPNDGYILDRKSGQGFGWPVEAVTYVKAWRDRVLFLDGETYVLLDNEMRQVHAFASAPGLALDVWNPLISPDGTKLAFVANGSLALVDLTPSLPAFRVVQPLPAERGDRSGLVWALQPLVNGREIALVSRQTPDAVSTSGSASVRRYGWDGILLSEVRLPDASDVRFSPDGALIAWETTLRDDGFDDGNTRNWPAVVVGDAKGTPFFRVKGASFCYGDEQSRYDGVLLGRRWLADGSGLVLNTRDGSALLSVRDRSLQPLRIGDYPQPAPERADVFAVGRIRVATLNGSTVSRPPVLPFSPAPYVTPWGDTGDELRFASSALDQDAPLACSVGAGGSPVIEGYPFPATVTRLRVAAAGDCLNLRSLPSQASSAVACIADRALLDIAAASFSPYQEDFLSVAPAASSLFMCGAGIGPEGGPPAALITAYGGWVHVRTLSGVEGWVSNEYVDWAE